MLLKFSHLWIQKKTKEYYSDEKEINSIHSNPAVSKVTTVQNLACNGFVTLYVKNSKIANTFLRESQQLLSTKIQPSYLINMSKELNA